MDHLEIFKMGFPRAFFFRSSEGYAPAGRCSFEEWERIFVRLGGIMGKTLEEEVPGRSKNISWFARYKKRHPEKLVLLHYNGNARDPRDNGEKFFAGHWIYYSGCCITRDVPAEDGMTDIHVEDPTLFRVNVGRYENKNEDIGLCMIGEDGKPDWHHSEQVQLVSIDVDRKIIKVKRGCYGTKPVAFPADKSWAAAHVTEGPWGDRSNLMWFYNYSTACPRDAEGRTCVDILVKDVASHFVPGGDLECYDGLEFDVLSHRRGSRPGADRGYDMDGDGKTDNGLIDGINTYGIGVYEFCRRLRRKLGEQKIIQADSFTPNHQRCFGVLNGVESEGWPALFDIEIEDWSGGMNRMLFWDQNARRPVFNYINHKFIDRRKGMNPSSAKALISRPALPFSIHRLVFAAGQFFDAAICYSFAPEPEPGEAYGIWDELCMGVERRPGWLGFPSGPPVRLALKQKDLLEGAGKDMTPEIVRRFQGDNVELVVEDGSLRASAVKQDQGSLAFRLKDVPCDGPDLFVSLKIRAAEMAAYPIDIARLVTLRMIPPEGEPVERMTWANPNWFEAGFYFHRVESGKVDLEFAVEGDEPVWLSGMTVHAHPDAVIREFENGVVLANPSLHEYTLDLDVLTPGRKYRRLIGSSKQDSETNNGSPVEGSVTLGERDGLFLVSY